VNVNVDCSSRFVLDGVPPQALTVTPDLRAWLGDLPDGATLSAVIRDVGTQRDPEPRLIGLRATWSETRPT
jgi:hypothetical protein